MTDVLCENGYVITVRRLGLFELSDNITNDIPGPYTVTVLFSNGQVFEQPFDASIEYHKPNTPLDECEENTQEWYSWQDYLRYKEATEIHPRKVYEAYCDYCQRTAQYIRQNCLMAIVPRWLSWLPLAAKRLISSLFASKQSELLAGDWQKIHQAVLCPEVTMEDIAAEMRLTFQGGI